MVYVVNCRECDLVRVNDTTFDMGNGDLVRDQHQHATFETGTHRVDFGLGQFEMEYFNCHDVAFETYFPEKGRDRLRADYDL